mgnify:CR=1 FL=1
MNLESRLIINSNAFFTRETKAPLVNDEYEKMFEVALMTTKKPLLTGISNGLGKISKIY